MESLKNTELSSYQSFYTEEILGIFRDTKGKVPGKLLTFIWNSQMAMPMSVNQPETLKNINEDHLLLINIISF